MDATASESAATYEKIKAYVQEKHGFKVSNLYIAQVKKKFGLPMRINYHLPQTEDAVQPQCPPKQEAAIVEALRYFQMV